MIETFPAPIPTEYRGVRFRSKSEAIFARALELRKYTTLEYEPRGFEVGGWCPDFWAVAQGTNNFITSLFIEYKPTSVTDSYKESLAEKFRLLGDKMHRSLRILACGNAFEDRYETFYLNDSEWVEVEDKLRLFRNIKEASKFRFDLK